MQKPTLFIGLDAGGTTTDLVGVSDDDEVLVQASHEALHASQLTPAVIAERIEGVLAPHREHYHIAGIGLGIAGGGRTETQTAISEHLLRRFPDSAIRVISDAEAAYLGAFGTSDGVLVIAGTGSLILAKQGDRYHRAGGYGYKVGDEGSATALTQAILREAGRDFDLNLLSSIRNLLAEKFKVTNQRSFITAVYAGELPPHLLLPPVFDLVASGDRKTTRLLVEESRKLARTTLELVHQLADSNTAEQPMVLHGGMFRSDHFKKAYLQALSGHGFSFRLEPAKYEPAEAVSLLVKSS